MRYPVGLLMVLLSLGGCGPHLSSSELGTVVFEVPKVSGSDEPYLMPQLGPLWSIMMNTAVRPCRDVKTGYDNSAGKAA